MIKCALASAARSRFTRGGPSGCMLALKATLIAALLITPPSFIYGFFFAKGSCGGWDYVRAASVVWGVAFLLYAMVVLPIIGAVMVWGS